MAHVLAIHRIPVRLHVNMVSLIIYMHAHLRLPCIELL
jgi:hypothetical protein